MNDVVREETADSTRGVQGWFSTPGAVQGWFSTPGAVLCNSWGTDEGISARTRSQKYSVPYLVSQIHVCSTLKYAESCVLFLRQFFRAIFPKKN